MDCTDCAGTGREAVTTAGGPPATTICGSCGGTGWVECDARAG